MIKVQASPTFRPLYEQIKILLTQSLIAGEWRPGEAIPSEIELANRFHVSQGTVRKAIDELAAENVLVRRQGRGTFVATHTEEEHTQHRFMRIVADGGKRKPTESRLIDCRRARVSMGVGRLLELRVGASVFSVKRILVSSGKPLIFDQITLPEELFEGLTANQLKVFKGSFYSFYESFYGVRTIRAEERLKAVAADAGVAQLLNIDPGKPLLCVERVAYTYGDKPVEWRRGLCDTEAHGYLSELT